MTQQQQAFPWRISSELEFIRSLGTHATVVPRPPIECLRGYIKALDRRSVGFRPGEPFGPGERIVLRDAAVARMATV
jgi:hypothetical protein